MIRRLAIALGVVVAAGCGSGTTAQLAVDRLRPRPRCAAPAIPREQFRHTTSGVLAAAAGARHAANDAVVAAGAPIVIGAKLAYGPTSKDLEDEDVALWMEDGTCAATEIARGRTDSDGRVTFTAPARAAGTYQFWVAPIGDATIADGTVWVIPPGQRTVVFDVDGTLTTGDAELIEEIVTDLPAEMYPDADAVARRWAETGHLVIYLTGRPYLLRESTRRWLDLHHFPPGPVMTTDHLRDAVPGAAGVGAFKTELVKRLVAAGIDAVRAYGNAATDVCAYARGGIAPDRTFIVGPDARRCDDHPPTSPLNSYTDHLRELGSRVKAR